MRTALAAALLCTPAFAQDALWINHEGDAALEATGFASSAVRMPDSLRIAADDFQISSATTTRLTEIVFYSVWIDPPVILGGDWYLYVFDDGTGGPGDLIVGEADANITVEPSGLVSSTFGTIYRNSITVDVQLEEGCYFLAFRTHCAPGAGKPVNAPLHPEWTNGNATALWNFSVTEGGDVLDPWQPMTVFHPTRKEWAFELYGVVGLDCIADLDEDGALTIFDFLMFQNLFDAGDPTADFDGDGSLTIFDFLAFQTAFDRGCE